MIANIINNFKTRASIKEYKGDACGYLKGM